MKRLIKSQLDRYFGQFARRNEVDNLRRQIACVMELQAAIQAPLPFGRLGGWAISADALALVVRDIRMRPSPKVIEFGSGVSTIAIAALLRSMGAGSLVTIEHDATYLKSVENDLVASGLQDLVELHHLSIVDYAATPGMNSVCRVYDLSRLDVAFDVALVDGPITALYGAATRLAPLEWCIRQLDPGASIYLG